MDLRKLKIVKMNKKEKQNGARFKCEACGAKMRNWRISKKDVLIVCDNCNHIKRDISLSNCNAREQTFGGNTILDYLRCKLTVSRLKSYIKKASLKEPLSILEIGFGTGNILKHFLKCGYNCCGIEADKSKAGYNLITKEEANLYFGKAENIDFGNNFDLIYAIHVVEHFGNPQLIFNKCFDVMKENGLLYFVTPNGQSMSLKIFKNKWWNLEDPTHIRFFSEKSITHMLKVAGFSDIRVSSLRLDSLTVEASSIFRFFGKSSKKGALQKPLGLLFSLFFLPLIILFRFLIPNLSPSMEISAVKKS